jgi:hypothetical protein
MKDSAPAVGAVGGVGSDSVIDRFATKFKNELSDVRAVSDDFYSSLSKMGTVGQRNVDPTGTSTEAAVSAIQEGSVMSAKLALQQVRFSLMHGGVVAATSTFKQLLKTT